MGRSLRSHRSEVVRLIAGKGARVRERAGWSPLVKESLTLVSCRRARARWWSIVERGSRWGGGAELAGLLDALL